MMDEYQKVDVPDPLLAPIREALDGLEWSTKIDLLVSVLDEVGRGACEAGEITSWSFNVTADRKLSREWEFTDLTFGTGMDEVAEIDREEWEDGD